MKKNLTELVFILDRSGSMGGGFDNQQGLSGIFQWGGESATHELVRFPCRLMDCSCAFAGPLPSTR